MLGEGTAQAALTQQNAINGISFSLQILSDDLLYIDLSLIDIL